MCVGVCVCWGGGELASRGDLNAFLRDGKRLVKFQNINGYRHVFLLPGELGDRGSVGVKAAVPPLHAGAMFARGGGLKFAEQSRHIISIRDGISSFLSHY